MKRRVIGILLTAMLMLSLIPAMAFAGDNESSNVTITSISYSGGEDGKIKDAGYSGGVSFNAGETITIYGTEDGVSKTWIYKCSLNEYKFDSWSSEQDNAPSIEYVYSDEESGYEEVPWNGMFTYKITASINNENYCTPTYTAKKTIMDRDNNVEHIGYSCIYDDGSVVLYACDRTALASATDIVIPEAPILADGIAHTVKKINMYALGGLPALKSVTIPATITEIEKYAVGYTVDGWEFDDEAGVNKPKNPVKNEGFMIRGASGSAAETYAKENGFKFVANGSSGHTHSVIHVPAKAATCDTAGNIEYWKCSACGKLFSDAGVTKEITAAATIIAAKGHSYGQWQTVKAATEISAGEESHKCTACGKVESRSIAELSPSLSAVKISKPNAAKKSATIKWKKLNKKALKTTKKIQIQYSLDKNFNTGIRTKYANAKKTSYKIKGLKSGKKYYVRIRAYTKSGGAVHVSKWSAKKSFRAK